MSDVLKEANKNPWYVLATLYGEQEGDALARVHAQNLNLWNKWARNNHIPNEALILFREKMGDSKAGFPHFEAQIKFCKTYFSKGLDCSGFEFNQTVHFNGSVFARGADFASAKFHNNANFASVNFEASANFDKTVFMQSEAGGANFDDTKFRGDAVFSSATFNETADFNRTVFCGKAQFSSAEFKKKTRFKEAWFRTAVPEFHAAKLYDDTVFPTKDHEQGNWPEVPIVGQEKSKKVMPADEQKRAYNRLRLFMNRSLQIDEELFFHRMEMRCKHVLAEKHHKWLYWLYEKLSNYGSSVIRPAGILVYLWMFGTSVKLQPIKGGACPDWDTLYGAMGWSFANMAPFFGFRGAYLERADYLNTEQIVVAGGQTIAGFVLLFLLGLGLRSQFRLR